MLARLPQQQIPDGPKQGSRPLAALTTRDSDDPTIALLNAWAMVMDVLTFYQERIIQESYLATATERRSVLELARAIGYELSPGLAASALLAFTVEDAPGAPEMVVVPKGTQIMSIPKPGQLPQIFETAEEFVAWADLNALKPLLFSETVSQKIDKSMQELYLKGTDTALHAGDGILIVGDERENEPKSDRWYFLILQSVELDAKKGRTLIRWEKTLGSDPPTNPKIFAFRQRAALFGHNAANWQTLDDVIKKKYLAGRFNGSVPSLDQFPEWPDFQIREDQLDLDLNYPKILPGTWVVLRHQREDKTSLSLRRVTKALTVVRSDYQLMGRITRIGLDTKLEDPKEFGVRETVVFAESEALALYQETLPATSTLQRSKSEIDLDRQVRASQRSGHHPGSIT
jgi:hypothetical protein